MALVAGAMGSLVPKLLQLLHDKYKLQKDVKAQVGTLAHELKAMHVALCKVAQVPYEQLDPQVKLWASEVREASYDMEDILDTFLVRVDGGNQTSRADKGKVHRLVEKMAKMFSLSSLKARHDIAGAIKEITKQVDEMARRRDRYKIDDTVANSSTTTRIDPRVFMTLHMRESELVGMEESMDALIKMLTLGDDKKVKIVSVVGPAGLGKTTLAKVVYEKFTVDMNISCKAFVPVGQNPNLKEVFRNILLYLDKSQYTNKINFTIWNESQLIEEIQTFLKEKRYFLVIDDVWDVASWEAIRIALDDDNNNLGSKIMITTRSSDVAEFVHCIYKIRPLHPHSSKILFYRRIFGSQDKCPEIFSELSDKILKKCDGVPLAIITIASLLANKSDDITQWQEVCSSIGSGLHSSNNMYNDMRKILSLSYHDLPSHMKTCFLYLSIYPEDYEIDRDHLIWKWICEGFIQPQRKGDDLFELGKSYFNDLINRSLVQPGFNYDDEIYGCRVHDMILDLICSLSREENFVTTSDDIEQETSAESKKLRRLSLKSTAMWPKKGVSQVRSFAVFWSCIDSTLSFSCFDMLRVLDLEGCSLKDCEGSIGNLIHLRYLGLDGTRLNVLPGGIEKLQFLQVLNMGRFVMPMKLLGSIFGLSSLMCIRSVACWPRSGNLLRNLSSLQVLDTLYVDKDPAGTVEALGHLTRLTELKVSIQSEMDQSICNAFIVSLGNLPRLQILNVDLSSKGTRLLMSWECWAPPLRLQTLGGIFSQTLPKWISPASLPHLVGLHIDVHTVGPEDIQILGTLPKLVELLLNADSKNYLEQPLQKFVVSTDAFPRLRSCCFQFVTTVPSMFPWGALPRVESIMFYLQARDFFSNPGGLGFDDLAMDHLPSLQKVYCNITTTIIREEEVAKLREALQHAADVHPNHPKLVL